MKVVVTHWQVTMENDRNKGRAMEALDLGENPSSSMLLASILSNLKKSGMFGYTLEMERNLTKCINKSLEEIQCKYFMIGDNLGAISARFFC